MRGSRLPDNLFGDSEPVSPRRSENGTKPHLCVNTVCVSHDVLQTPLVFTFDS